MPPTLEERAAAQAKQQAKIDLDGGHIRRLPPDAADWFMHRNYCGCKLKGILPQQPAEPAEMSIE
jgi:hypothetical protein